MYRRLAMRDVVIVGAGVAGLAAEQFLKTRNEKFDIMVLEAREYIGGRARTFNFPGTDYHVDLGAAWIHGWDGHPFVKNKLVSREDARIVSSSNFWTSRTVCAQNCALYCRSELSENEQYEPVQLGEGMDTTAAYVLARIDKAAATVVDNTPFLDIANHVMGNMSINNRKLTEREMIVVRWVLDCHGLWLGVSLNTLTCQEWASMSIDEDWGDFPGPHAIIAPHGLGQAIVDFFEPRSLKLSAKVTTMAQTRGHDGVNVVYEAPGSSGTVFVKHTRCSYTICTIPIGPLKANHNLFDPPLPPEKRSALASMTMADYLKIFLVFDPKDDIVWAEGENNTKSYGWLGVADGLAHPFALFFNYYKFTNQPVLVGFAYGNAARELGLHSSDKVILNSAVTTLSKCFHGTPPEELSTRVKHFHVTRWGNDPYCLGAYPFSSSADHETAESLTQPHGRIYFAGDGIVTNGSEGSVASAFSSGIYAAKSVLIQLRYDNFIGRLKTLGVRTVCFDMDRCAVNQHSFGRLERGKKELQFVKNATKDFVGVVPRLLEAGLNVAITTHSDESEYISNNRPREKYIIGKDLVESLLHFHFPPSLVEKIFIYAWKPSVHGDNAFENQHKKKHIREAARYFGHPIKHCILFDDLIRNTRNTEGWFSWLVDKATGFSIDVIQWDTVQHSNQETLGGVTMLCYDEGHALTYGHYYCTQSYRALSS